MSKPIIPSQVMAPLQPALIDAMLEQLSVCGFRFTQEFHAPAAYSMDAVKPQSLVKVLVLDTETTGKDVALDKIVELGLILVEVDPVSGRAFDILATYKGREDPGMPIHPDASRVHGITDEMVAGLSLDDDRVLALVEQADWVIAHNGKFDRPIAEVRFPVLQTKNWACSLSQVPWLDQGMGSAKLEFLAYKHGLHYNSHSALDDCQILLEVLQRPLPDGQMPMQILLATAQACEFEVWALGAPFAAKDLLKARKYQWKAEPDKVWVGTVAESALAEEFEWLGNMVYDHRQVSIGVGKLHAGNRFTNRRDPYVRTPINQPKPQPVELAPAPALAPEPVVEAEQKVFDWADEI